MEVIWIFRVRIRKVKTELYTGGVIWKMIRGKRWRAPSTHPYTRLLNLSFAISSASSSCPFALEAPQTFSVSLWTKKKRGSQIGLQTDFKKQCSDYELSRPDASSVHCADGSNRWPWSLQNRALSQQIWQNMTLLLKPYFCYLLVCPNVAIRDSVAEEQL